MKPYAFPLPLSQAGQKALEQIRQSPRAPSSHLPLEYIKLDASAFPGWVLFETQEWGSKFRIEHSLLSAA